MILFLSPSIVLSLRCANALNLVTRAQLRPQSSNCPTNNLSFVDPHSDQNHRDVYGWGPLSALWKHCLENVRRNPRNPQTILRRQWEQWRQSLDHLAEEDEHLGLVPDSFWLDHSTIFYLRNSKKKVVMGNAGLFGLKLGDSWGNYPREIYKTMWKLGENIQLSD